MNRVTQCAVKLLKYRGSEGPLWTDLILDMRYVGQIAARIQMIDHRCET